MKPEPILPVTMMPHSHFEVQQIDLKTLVRWFDRCEHVRFIEQITLCSKEGIIFGTGSIGSKLCA